MSTRREGTKKLSAAFCEQFFHTYRFLCDRRFDAIQGLIKQCIQCMNLLFLKLHTCVDFLWDIECVFPKRLTLLGDGDVQRTLVAVGAGPSDESLRFKALQ